MQLCITGFDTTKIQGFFGWKSQYLLNKNPVISPVKNVAFYLITIHYSIETTKNKVWLIHIEQNPGPIYKIRILPEDQRGGGVNSSQSGSMGDPCSKGPIVWETPLKHSLLLVAIVLIVAVLLIVIVVLLVIVLCPSVCARCPEKTFEKTTLSVGSPSIPSAFPTRR